MKTCRHCGTPDQTAMRRPGSYTVLCAECHLDMQRNAREFVETASEPDVRVWTPRETGVLKYQPFRTVNGQGGGR